MIIFRITLKTLPEKQKEVMQTLLSIVECTTNEKGCLRRHVYHDIEDENIFSLIDEWDTREDLEQYLKSTKFGVLLGIKSLLLGHPDIQIYTVGDSEGMAAVKAAREKTT